jgi:hypothetical protein
MSKYTEHVQALLQRQMTRKQFIASLGVVFLSLLGIGELLNSLDKNVAGDSQDPTVYGFGDYSEHPEG